MRGERRSPEIGFGAVKIVVKEQLLHWKSGLPQSRTGRFIRTPAALWEDADPLSRISKAIVTPTW
jgi:hypothetical protein